MKTTTDEKEKLRLYYKNIAQKKLDERQANTIKIKLSEHFAAIFKGWQDNLKADDLEKEQKRLVEEAQKEKEKTEALRPQLTIFDIIQTSTFDQ